MFSEQCLLLRLQGYLIPFAPLAFIPHCQIRTRKMPSLIVSPVEINAFYRYLNCTSCAFRSQSHAVPLARPILEI